MNQHPMQLQNGVFARRESKLKRLRVHIQDWRRLRFGNTPERVIAKAPALLPGLPDAVLRTDHRVLFAGAGENTVYAGRFYVISEQQRRSPQYHYTTLFSFFPPLFIKNGTAAPKIKGTGIQPGPDRKHQVQNAIHRP